MDELNGWVPGDELRGCDLAVLPMGICEFDVVTGERRIDERHPILRYEATFEETLAIVDRLDAGRVVLSHVEEMDGLSFDDLLARRGGTARAWTGADVRLRRHVRRRLAPSAVRLRPEQ